MLATTQPAIADRLPLRHDPLPTETNFYSAYDWCLDPHLTFGETIERLAGEIDRLPSTPAGWQTAEVTTNAYLLCCSLLGGIDEYLRGYTLRLPSQLAKTRPGRIAMWMTDNVAENLPKRSRAQVRRWKEEWRKGLDGFFAVLIGGDTDPASFVESAETLASLLRSPLPSDLLGSRLGIPSAFRRLNLTHFDVLALGRQFVRQYPDRSQPILLLGLRTAGTYFSELLLSYFKTEGYRQVAALTVHPKKGPSREERKKLTRSAKQGFTLVIADDPPRSGGAVLLAVEIARRAGFDMARIKALLPIDHASGNWADTLPDGFLVALEPQGWRKQQLLDSKNVEARLREYFTHQGFSDVKVIGGRRVDEINAGLQNGSNRKRGAALKRVFEAQLRTPQGTNEIRYVLAESVGLGYLGYHAFLAAHRLSDFVPPVLGLRDGVLYTEWLPQRSGNAGSRWDRNAWIERMAAYVAARTHLLSLPKQRRPGKAVHENGLGLLAESFGHAYGRFLVDIPMRSWIQQRLYRLRCPVPTLIDGNMGRAEWIEGEYGPLKTGYYRHGLGKIELNVIDPAYDLAEIILSFELSPEEERRLIRRYIDRSGDVAVGRRLFLQKLLAGLWTMRSAQEHLFETVQTGRLQQQQQRRYLGAWDFLSLQSARFCGSLFRALRPPLRWRAPLVVLDVDGVLEWRVFGYPCSTAAGIEALSLLAASGHSVALNTARSVAEVKAYCEAYGLAGGVAEHGAYVWDAVAKRGKSLVDPEAMRQLDELREHLQRIPGVLLDSRHQYSVRAFMFENKTNGLLAWLLDSVRPFCIGQGRPIPLPTPVISHLLMSLRLDRLSFHHTNIDTAIVVKATDKGTGMAALRDWVLGPDAETIAVGDTEADLPMFRMATRSFAPAQISCSRQARLLGCVISRYRYQRGLLDIARRLTACKAGAGPIEMTSDSDGETLFLNLLRDADHRNSWTLIRALFDRTTFRIFVR